jgi:hypothetical protein
MPHGRPLRFFSVRARSPGWRFIVFERKRIGLLRPMRGIAALTRAQGNRFEGGSASDSFSANRCERQLRLSGPMNKPPEQKAPALAGASRREERKWI